MAWHEHLNRLRAKPEAQRRQLAFWSSLALTLVITIVWSLSLQFTLKSGSGQVAKTNRVRQTAAVVGSDSSWWPAAQARLKTGWQKLTK